ncbi:MAG: lipopolysaccharide kinase InaA family protein [Methylophilaceae bacterium]
MTKKENASVLASFGLEAPVFTLEDGSALESLEVVRYVPKRRCVCRAIWQGKRVYVKLFFGAKATDYALRDVGGVNHFHKKNILTPKILHQSQLTRIDAFVIVFEEIVAAKNAEEFLAGSNEKSRLEFAKQLVQTLAEHHEVGLMQTDLYLKNFLVDGDKIYSIDGDGVRSYGVLTEEKALNNLSQLLSKFDVLMLAQHLPVLSEAYSAARSWRDSPDISDIKTRVSAVRVKATVAYADKKVFRQCTDVDVARTEKRFIAISSVYSNLALPKTTEKADAYFKPENIIKNGNTCTVALANIGKQRVVIKRYNIKNFWHGVGRALRQTRAAASWGNAHRLQLLGLETAHPIALIETRTFGLKGKAYYFAEYVDAPDMIAFFKQSQDKALRANAVKQTVQLFYRMFLLKISHGDMKATNIKVLADGKPSLIDLDSMQQHKVNSFAQKAHVRDIKRFMQNWKGQPSLYNAFVKVFKVVYADHAPLRAAQILE